MIFKRASFKTPSFVQSLRHAQILILEIFYIFLWLKFSPSLTLNKLKCFENGSTVYIMWVEINDAFRLILEPRIEDPK